MGPPTIWYREKPRDPWESWGLRAGSRQTVLDSALRLLDTLYDEGLARPAVRVGNGQPITRRKPPADTLEV